MIGAIEACVRISRPELDTTVSHEAQIGDHRGWISEMSPFTRDYPGWSLTSDLEDLLRKIHNVTAERWVLMARERGTDGT